MHNLKIEYKTSQHQAQIMEKSASLAGDDIRLAQEKLAESEAKCDELSRDKAAAIDESEEKSVRISELEHAVDDVTKKFDAFKQSILNKEKKEWLEGLQQKRSKEHILKLATTSEIRIGTLGRPKAKEGDMVLTKQASEDTGLLHATTSHVNSLMHSMKP